MKTDEKLGIVPFGDDDDLVDALRRDGKPHVRVYRSDRVRVILGRGSNVESEVHLARIREDNVPLERRAGGGCAVVLDPGNVIVSVVLPIPGLGETRRWFKYCCDWLAAGLERCGVNGVHVSGISDLAIGDRKIAGTALHRSKGLLYFSASLLVTPRLELLDRYLPHPPREPDYRSKRPHRAFVIGLNEAAGIKDAAEFERSLRSVLSANELIAMGVD